MDAGRLQTGTARRFRLQSCIGKGGFGEVYLAEMSTSSGFVKTVAVKVLREDVQGHEQVASRLRDEARLLGLLRHPAIVRADDLITLAGRPAVVMEYVPGVNLSWLINPKRNPEKLPPTVTVAILRRVASALEAAYSQISPSTGQPLKVMHRDIKPGNIRITADGEVKVLDFGIARSEHQGREADTQNYQLGSLRYMSPELMSGRGASHASDVYALGVVAFETLARKRLGWAGEAADVHENQVQSRLEEADLSAFRGDAWNVVVDLLARMLAYEPDMRPTARQVVEDLRLLEAQVEGPSLEVWAPMVLPKVEIPEEPKDADLSGQTLFEDATGGHAEPEPPELELDEPEPEPLQAVDSGAAGRFLLWTGVAVAVALVLAVGWWFVLGPGSSQPPPAPEPVVEAPIPTPPAPVVEPPVPVEEPPVVAEAPADAEPPVPAVEPPAAPSVAAASTPATSKPAPAPTASKPAPAPVVLHLDPKPGHSPAPAPAATGGPVKVRFASVPFGLAVYLDGTLLGSTPRQAEVTPGHHSLMFVDGERTQRVEIEVVPGGKSIWTYNRNRGDLQ
ncbi:MAG: protein kinase [Pseudomonadota bacterium]